MTNGDRIRQMSNEELASFLSKLQAEECDISCYGCMFVGTHHADPDDEQYHCGNCYFNDIGEDVEKWLNKEEEKV
ncbi:MAG: hypothetical protein IKK84_00355 [Clostridia bacterium]|nr:hypothetical protein [Clostridia bacterium]